MLLRRDLLEAAERELPERALARGPERAETAATPRLGDDGPDGGLAHAVDREVDGDRELDAPGLELRPHDADRDALAPGRSHGALARVRNPRRSDLVEREEHGVPEVHDGRELSVLAGRNHLLAAELHVAPGVAQAGEHHLHGDAEHLGVRGVAVQLVRGHVPQRAIGLGGLALAPDEGVDDDLVAHGIEEEWRDAGDANEISLGTLGGHGCLLWWPGTLCPKWACPLLLTNGDQ